MNYTEFKKFDTINAFSDYISVRQAKALGSIPKEYEDIISDICDGEYGCKSDRITSRGDRKEDDNATITCCNPNCRIKSANRLSNIFNSFECKNLGPATCMKIITALDNSEYRDLPLTSLFNLDEKQDLFIINYTQSGLENLRFAKSIILKKRFRFCDIVKHCCIPLFGDDCLRIFRDIENSEDLVNKIDQEGSLIDFLANRGVYDRKRVFYFYFFMKDIFQMEVFLRKNMLMPPKGVITVAITGRVSVRNRNITRQEFLSICNSMHGGLIQIKEKAANSANFIIADSPSSNRKYKIAMERESRGEKVLMTANDFIDYINGGNKDG